jgi:hypothetical protein
MTKNPEEFHDEAQNAASSLEFKKCNWNLHWYTDQSARCLSETK